MIPLKRKIEGKPLHYQQDGTGRDGYISFNHGGFSSIDHGRNFDFTLRMYERSPSKTRLKKYAPTDFEGLGVDDSFEEQDFFTIGQRKITDKRAIRDQL